MVIPLDLHREDHAQSPSSIQEARRMYNAQIMKIIQHEYESADVEVKMVLLRLREKLESFILL